MKFICLGYMDEQKWASMTETERNTFMDKCFTYDDELRRNGHFVGGEALQAARSAATIRSRNGKVVVTDGPFSETKEQLGGIMILEARDFEHALELMSKHPSILMGGSFEVRPGADLSGLIEESDRRRNPVEKAS
jgi:hypothetical protein